MAKDMRKLTVTKCPTYGTWFEKFNRGIHKRMGDISKPDKAISVPVLLEIMKALDQEWEDPLLTPPK
jgi:ribosomal protein S10